MNMSQKILTIYPELNNENLPFLFSQTIILQDNFDGRGPYIAKWDHPVYAKPTQAQLDALNDVEYTPIITSKNYNDLIKEYLNQVAVSKGYDNAISLLTYIDDINSQWASEARKFADWRSQVWSFVFTNISQIENQNVTWNNFKNQLPQIQWD